MWALNAAELVQEQFLAGLSHQEARGIQFGAH